jgi:hypothetical protein
MGLDNGFYVKSNRSFLTRDDLPNGIRFPFEKDYGDGIEVVYWRKNWGLRAAVTSILVPEEVNYEAGEIPYNYYAYKPSQVIEVIEVIASFLDEDRWEEEGHSIWTYEEVRPRLIQDIINLALISVFMEENPDVYLEFYDRY